MGSRIRETSEFKNGASSLAYVPGCSMSTMFINLLVLGGCLILKETSDYDADLSPCPGLAAFSTLHWTLPSTAPIPLAHQTSLEEECRFQVYLTGKSDHQMLNDCLLL